MAKANMYRLNVICNDIDEVIVNGYCNEILKQLAEQQKKDDPLCDVELIAGKLAKRIPAHRNVLAAVSPHFRRIFSETIKEGNCQQVILTNLDETAVQMLVEYCYSGTIQLTPDVVNILVAADYLYISAVIDFCSNYLMRHLNPTNSLSVTNLAELFGLMDLFKISSRFSNENFEEVSKSEQFLRLDYRELSELLQRDDLIVPSEEHVFFAMMKWIEHAPQEREKLIPSLLKLIRLQHLELKFLKDHVKNVAHSNDCSKLIMDALFMKYESHGHENGRRYGCMQVTKFNVPNERFDIGLRDDDEMNHNQSEESNNTFNGESLTKWEGFDSDKLVVFYYNEHNLTIGRMCPESLEVTPLKILGEAIYIYNPPIVAEQKVFYALRTGISYFDLKTGETTQLPPMIKERNFKFRMAILDGFLYVIGGIMGLDPNLAERCNLKTKVWSRIATKLNSEKCGEIMSFNGLLYVLGIASPQAHNSWKFECYDPRTNQWFKKTALNYNRKFNYEIVKLATLDGNLYAFVADIANGKAEVNIRTLRYNHSIDEWSDEIFSFSFDSQLTQFRYFKIEVHNERIYIFDNTRIKAYSIKLREWVKSNTNLELVHVLSINEV